MGNLHTKVYDLRNSLTQKMSSYSPSVASFSTTTVAPSNKTFLDIPPQFLEPKASMWFRLVFFGVITLAALVGNGIVIRSIMNIPYRKPFTYHMVTNLAVAELMSTISLPFIQAYDLMNTWKFGELMCQITNPMQITSSLVVTWTLAIISVHRYRTLVSPSRRPLFLKNAPFLMFGLWVSAIAITFPSYMYSTLVKSPYENDREWCVVLFPGDTLWSFPSSVYRRYLIVRFGINFLLPILIMVLAYGAMGVKLKYHMATIRNTDADLSVSNTAITMRTSVEEVAPENLNNLEDGPSLINIYSSSFENPSSNQNEKLESPNIAELKFSGNDTFREKRNSTIPSLGELKAAANTVSANNTSQDDISQTVSTHSNLLIEFEQDLLKMIYVIVLVFVFFYFPYQVFFLLEYFGTVAYGNWHYFHITRRYIFLITCLPSALHPLCYGTMSKFYAKAFRNIVLCKWTRQFIQNGA